MDNEYNQSQVAYGQGPKEVSVHKGMPSGDKQFGKHKMPQDSKKSMKDHGLSMYRQGRHKEHR